MQLLCFQCKKQPAQSLGTLLWSKVTLQGRHGFSPPVCFCSRRIRDGPWLSVPGSQQKGKQVNKACKEVLSSRGLLQTCSGSRRRWERLTRGACYRQEWVGGDNDGAAVLQNNQCGRGRELGKVSHRSNAKPALRTV